jgi:hypothetical protein
MKRTIVACVGVMLACLCAGEASACISFDRPAELRAVNRAIKARHTPSAVKKELRDLRETMATDNDAATKAMKLINRSRIAKAAVTGGNLPKGPIPRGCG